jgi:hypothetical protein
MTGPECPAPSTAILGNFFDALIGDLLNQGPGRDAARARSLEVASSTE